MGKSIEVVDVQLAELVDGLGNPRKIKKKKAEELKRSLEDFGDFGIIVIDERNNIVSGHQRVDALRAINPDAKVHCKRLIGYSQPELRAINIAANSHAGEWDLDALSSWVADLNINVGDMLPEVDIGEKAEIKEMEPLRYEKYSYVLIACRNEIDYFELERAFGLDGKREIIAQTHKGMRKIKARAVWFDQISNLIKLKK